MTKPADNLQTHASEYKTYQQDMKEIKENIVSDQEINYWLQRKKRLNYWIRYLKDIKEEKKE
jgi:hypothetical protein